MESRVLCVGSGGLGSPALYYLAAAGVGRISIIDPDTVSVSNLQRQILFQTADEGKSKVQVAKNALLALNPEIDVVAYSESLTDKNAISIFNQNDIVIDGSDNFATKYLINDAAYVCSKPFIYGSVSRFEGRVALFNPREGSCYRCLYPLPPKETIQNCAESGVLGSVVGTIGTLQATLALQYLVARLNPSHPLRPEMGTLLLFDFKGGWSTDRLRIPKKPECPTCSKNPSELQLEYSPEACSKIPTISPHDLKDLLNSKSKWILVDVREAEEWNDGHLPHARHWPLSMIENGECVSDIPLEPSTPMILYCTAGLRSEVAAGYLRKSRSLNCISLQGGLLNWQAKALN